ncbi:metallophosphoesterase family protein [Bacillus sp. JJ1521]|uniref:metallophosphoesterase family protein n=1 Tax=Bacillus sp. JJ1521 TaxID=3122957 RepID=UPI002FFFF2CA
MTRLLVISDIHGCLVHFNALLKKANFRPSEDKLILLGDYVDRGPNSKEVIERVSHMVKNENVIALRGNHDQRFLDVILTRKTELYDKFLKYGGLETLKSYYPNAQNESIDHVLNIIIDKYSHHIEFLKASRLYYEEEQFLFVHAGINPNIKNLKNQSPIDLLNIRKPFIISENTFPKKVVFGHTQTYEIHQSNEIWFSKNKIGIDGGCVFKNQLNCLEIVNSTVTNQYKVNYHDFN